MSVFYQNVTQLIGAGLASSLSTAESIHPGQDPMMLALRDPFAGAGLRSVCQACVKANEAVRARSRHVFQGVEGLIRLVRIETHVTLPERRPVTPEVP